MKEVYLNPKFSYLSIILLSLKAANIQTILVAYATNIVLISLLCLKNASILTLQLCQELLKDNGQRPLNPTPSQAFMLRLILKNTQLSQQEISVHLGIAKATTTRILLGLENKKLIKRTPANSDARISLVSATRKAQTITQELDNCSQAVTLKIKKLISNTMFEKTVSQLKLIRDALN